MLVDGGDVIAEALQMGECKLFAQVGQGPETHRSGSLLKREPWEKYANGEAGCDLPCYSWQAFIEGIPRAGAPFGVDAIASNDSEGPQSSSFVSFKGHLRNQTLLFLSLVSWFSFMGSTFNRI